MLEVRGKNQNKFLRRVIRLSLSIIGFVNQLSSIDYNLVFRKQIIRSCTSIGANIVEAKGSPTKKDYCNFFSHALKSANETIYWLAMIRYTNKKLANKCDEFILETEEVCKILAASIKTIRSNL